MRPMPCEHVGGPELIEMAERFLRENHIDETQWAGRKFRWSENVEGGMWASVILEVERRADGWVVTRLDRSNETVDDAGFRALEVRTPRPPGAA
jgi:hypothetical protein